MSYDPAYLAELSRVLDRMSAEAGSATLVFEVLADSMCQDKISREILRKESAWERRNRNAPFYRNLKKNRR